MPELLTKHVIKPIAKSFLEESSPEDASATMNQVYPRVETGDHCEINMEIRIGDKVSRIEDLDPENRAEDIEDGTGDPEDR